MILTNFVARGILVISAVPLVNPVWQMDASRGSKFVEIDTRADCL